MPSMGGDGASLLAARAATMCHRYRAAMSVPGGVPPVTAPGRGDQRFAASTPSSAGSALNPAFSSRFATSRGTSRPLVSLFGAPV